MGKFLFRVALFVCACLTAFSQGTTSRVVGTVQDSSGAVIPGAIVKLTNSGTNVTFTTTSTGAGGYGFEAVQPGTYQLEVEAKGFKNFVSRDNLVTIGQPATVNAKIGRAHV